VSSQIVKHFLFEAVDPLDIIVTVAVGDKKSFDIFFGVTDFLRLYTLFTA
jgi:hypothetical protein